MNENTRYVVQGRPFMTTHPDELPKHVYQILGPDDMLRPGDEVWTPLSRWLNAIGALQNPEDVDKGVWVEVSHPRPTENRIVRRKLDPITALGRLA